MSLYNKQYLLPLAFGWDLQISSVFKLALYFGQFGGVVEVR